MEAVTRTYDLAVIGGGPAGSAAAITAQHLGARVLLLERGRFPRHKVCGEFVSAESLGILADLLANCPGGLAMLQNTPRIPLGRLFVDGQVLSAPFETPAASISRYDLDRHLWEAAVRAGVDARQQYTVSGIAGSVPFTVTTATESFAARSIINASGRWSNLSRTEMLQGARAAKWIGLKAHFREGDPFSSVDLYFFEGGYCGIQPLQTSPENIINACAMVRSDVGSSLEEVFEQHPGLRERSRKWEQITEPVSTAPLVFKTPRPTSGNILMAGDAAGFVDPFVGDGISLALRSGRLAARNLKPFWEGQLELQDAVNIYRETYQQQLLPVFRASSKVRRLLALPYAARAPLLRLFSAAPSLTRYFVRKTR